MLSGTFLLKLSLTEAKTLQRTLFHLWFYYERLDVPAHLIQIDETETQYRVLIIPTLKIAASAQFHLVNI